jgi:hypothetical protein
MYEFGQSDKSPANLMLVAESELPAGEAGLRRKDQD